MRLCDAAICFCQALFFPQNCVLCGAWVANPDLSPLCRPCLAALPRHSGPQCQYCGVCLPANVADAFAVCSACRAQRHLFDLARSAGPYEGALRDLIRKYKFDGFRRLASPLAAILESVCAAEPGLGRSDWILAVPLHPRRRRERGFDQTLLLARLLSARLGVPVFSGLRRIRQTAPQFGLDHEERARNVRGAFGVTGAEALADASVLLIDDVMTTGATVNECARVLKMAGAVRVYVVTVARG